MCTNVHGKGYFHLLAVNSLLYLKLCTLMRLPHYRFLSVYFADGKLSGIWVHVTVLLCLFVRVPGTGDRTTILKVILYTVRYHLKITKDF